MHTALKKGSQNLSGLTQFLGMRMHRFLSVCQETKGMFTSSWAVTVSVSEEELVAGFAKVASNVFYVLSAYSGQHVTSSIDKARTSGKYFMGALYKKCPGHILTRHIFNPKSHHCI